MLGNAEIGMLHSDHTSSLCRDPKTHVMEHTESLIEATCLLTEEGLPVGFPFSD